MQLRLNLCHDCHGGSYFAEDLATNLETSSGPTIIVEDPECRFCRNLQCTELYIRIARRLGPAIAKIQALGASAIW
jgi:hypothetical protein